MDISMKRAARVNATGERSENINFVYSVVVKHQNVILK